MPHPLDFDDQPGSCRPIRIATWNLHNCRAGFDRVARQLRALDADVVGLQEVDRGTRRSGGVDQAAELARTCGYRHFQFFRAIARDRGEYGVALLSRFPLSGQRVGMLPNRPRFEQRVVATAVVEFPPVWLAVSVTHLTNSRSDSRLRREQARWIAAHHRDCPLPQVLLGDLNEPPFGPMWHELTPLFSDVFAAVGQGDGGTFPVALPFLPALRFDYVFASRDLGLAAARVVRTRASDHHPLVAELWLPPPAPTRFALFG